MPAERRRRLRAAIRGDVLDRALAMNEVTDYAPSLVQSVPLAELRVFEDLKYDWLTGPVLRIFEAIERGWTSPTTSSSRHACARECRQYALVGRRIRRSADRAPTTVIFSVGFLCLSSVVLERLRTSLSSERT